MITQGGWPDASPGVCSDLDLERRTFARGDVFVWRMPSGFEHEYYLKLERDLNDDGRLDVVLQSVDGCSRSAGCMTYVFASCGDGSFGEVANLESAQYVAAQTLAA